MEFLQLFPANDSQSTPLIFTNYRQMGLLCWNSAQPNTLTLVSALTTDSISGESFPNNGINTLKTCNVLFKPVTRVQLSPELPRNVEFSQLLVNSTGSYVALVGKQMVFIIEMDPDFWHRRNFVGSNHVDYESNVEHLRADYFSRCDLLHVTLFMRKYPPSVLKATWFDAQEDAKNYFDRVHTLLPNGLLALLYSDNVIRLYDVNLMLDRSVAQFDFNVLLPDRNTPSESGDEFVYIGGTASSSNASSRPHSTLGFLTQLVSFDFGPMHLVTSDDSVPVSLYSSILTLDSNGELYVAFFPVKLDSGFSIPQPIGPLPCQMPATKPSISTHFLCSALDLHCIRHAQSQLISVWALASEDGLIIHLVLTRRMTQSSDHIQNMWDIVRIEQLLGIDTSSGGPLLKSPFELFTIECLEIAKTSAAREQKQKFPIGPKAGALFRGEYQQTIEKKVLKPYKDNSLVVAKAMRLQSDNSGSSAAYFVICSRDVYQVSVTPLLAHLFTQCGITKQQTATENPQSLIYQLLMFAHDEKENLSISSLATLHLGNLSTFESSTTSMENFTLEQYGRQQQLLMALCCDIMPNEDVKMIPRQKRRSFLATLLSRRPTIQSFFLSSSTFADSTTKHTHRHLANTMPSIVNEIRNQLAQQEQFRLPTVKFDNEEETTAINEIQQLARRVQHLSLMQSAIEDTLVSKALPQRDQAINYGIRRAADMLAAFKAMDNFHTSSQQRLTTIFRQIIDMKTQILSRKREFLALEERVRRIFHTMQPLMFSAASQEQDAIDRLREIQHHLVKCKQEITKLNHRLHAHRQMLFRNKTQKETGGASEMWQPSLDKQMTTSTHISISTSAGGGTIPAQMYILSKNGRDCTKLREQLLMLEKQIDGRQSE